MAIPILRNYQLSAEDKLLAAFGRKIRRALAVIPTGGGKTNLACNIMLRAVRKGKRVLFIAHRKELIDQAHARLFQYGVMAGRIQGKDKFTGNSVNVASVQTLIGLEQLPEADLVFIDEAHHFVLQGMKIKAPDATDDTPRNKDAPKHKDSMYAKIFNHYKDTAHFIGLTATPTRLDGKGLAGVFEELITADVEGEIVDIAWLQNEGFLVPVSYYGAPFSIDTSDLKTNSETGDFNQREVFDRLNKKEVYEGIVENWLKHASGLKTIAFCTKKEACIKLVAEFSSHGIKSDYIEANMSKAVREHKLDLFSQGYITVLVNIDILTEGYDLPAIECVIANRATDSVSLWLQIIGRGLRPVYANGYDLNCKAGRLEAIARSKKRRLIVLDNGTNCKRLGFAEDAREYSLEGRKKGNENGGVAPVTECNELKGGCGLFYPASMKACPECGRVPDAADKPAPKKVEMVELKAPELPERLAGLRIGQMTFEDLEAYRAHKKYTLRWLVHQIKLRAEYNAKKLEQPDQIPAIFEKLLYKYAAMTTETKTKVYKSGWIERQLKDFLPQQDN